MNENNKEIFWDASVEEVKKGYIELEDCFKCVLCEEKFLKGRIYEIEGLLYDSRKAAELHLLEKHHSVLDYLLNMNPVFTGISEIQRELLVLIAQGLTDKEIALKLGVAQSTIRNHRYKLREKEKQARLFLAMMELIASNSSKKVNVLDKEVLQDAHKTATTIDDRYNVTDSERESTIKAHIDEVGALKTFPAREKKKLIILSEIVKNFSKGKKYPESEINRILKRIYEDYATIRRALIEYGFLERSNDCSSYWVKE